MNNRLVELLSGWSVQHRGVILALSGLIVAVFSLGLPRLQVDSSPDALVSTVEGQADVERRFREHFPGSETQLFVVLQSEDVTRADDIRHQAELAAHLKRVENVVKVDTIADFWVSRIEAVHTGKPLEFLRAPRWVTPLLLSRDQRVAAIIVHFDDDEVFDQATRIAALQRVRDVVSEHPTPDDLRIELGGVPVLRDAILKKLERDRLTLNPAMMLICLLVLGLTFRWWPAVVAPICAVGIAALLVVGGMGYLGVPLTILTNIIPPLLIIVGLSDSVHLLGRYGEELRLDSDRVAAGRRAARAMLVACFLTSLTTAVGFGSLSVAKTPELGRFGIAAAAGVIFAYFATVLFVPAFVTLTRPPTRTAHAEMRVGILERLVFVATRLVLDHARWVALVSLILTVGLAWGATRVTVDARLLDAFDEDEPVSQLTRLMEDKLSGIRPLQVMLEGQEGALLEPEVQRRVDTIATWAESHPDVIAVRSYRGLLETSHLMGWERSKPLRDWLTEDGSVGRMTVFFKDTGIRRTLSTLDELKQQFARGATKELRISLLGEAYTGSVGRDYVLRDLLAGLALALVAIFALLTLLFRSVRLGLVAMPPNLIPLLATGAYMMARGIHLNMATVITFSIGIGLAVDDTVHVVARFVEERRRISSVRVALLRAARGTGRAIVVTAISLSLGFAVLLLSEFVSVRHFGELIAITVINCLISALFIQPALLLLVTRRGKNS